MAAVAPKPLRLDYLAFNSKAGLTDVKGQVYVNGVAKAVGSNAVSATELDSTNSKGLYTYLATSAQLAAWGVVAGAENTVEIYFNSASWPGPGPVRGVAQFATADDVIAILGTPAGATLSADIAAIFARIGAPAAASVAADIANLATQQATLLAQVQALANASDTGGVGVVTLQGLISSGTYPLSVPFTVSDNDGNLYSPTNLVVTMQNASGADRGSNITGATSSGGGAYTFTPTPVSTGVFAIPVVIPANNNGNGEETWVMKFIFTGANGKQRALFATINVVTDLSAAGYATQTSVNAIATNVSAILTKINDATNGLANIETTIQNALTQATQANTNAQSAVSGIATANAGINTVQSTLTAMEGANWTSAASLQGIYAAIQLIPISGGRGI